MLGIGETRQHRDIERRCRAPTPEVPGSGSAGRPRLSGGSDKAIEPAAWT
jgi:hypothetical protein